MSDLRVAKRSIEDLYPKEIYVAAGLSQQAAEKALKAFLLYHNVIPPKTHNLVNLCKMCAAYNDDFTEFLDDCGNLTPFAVGARYPDEMTIDEWQAESAVEKADRILKFCSEQIQELRLSKQEQTP
jgi:HEPN domain-containing protein